MIYPNISDGAAVEKNYRLEGGMTVTSLCWRSMFHLICSGI